MIGLRTGEVDATQLRVFRGLFGTLLALSVVRFWANGWIDSIYVDPTFHFSYVGFEWLQPWSSSAAVHAHFGTMFVAARLLAVGKFPRLAAAVFCVLFTTAELWEKASYLNHYYFVSLVTFLLVFIPTNRATVSRLAYTALRFQTSVVYMFAGLAKLNADWLFRGEPLATWLAPHLGWDGLVVPLAVAMSWAGAVFDLTIWAFMLHPRTRKPAFAVAVVFHLVVWALFPIGVFSFVMIAALTVFFGATNEGPRSTPTADLRLLKALFTLYAIVQLVVPLRHLAYAGSTNWNEAGFRFAWRVMLVEKVGTVEFVVKSSHGAVRIHPRKELTRQQYKQMSTQPDMIVQYAHELSRRHGGAAVFAHSFVAYNGRRSQRYLRDDVDLSRVDVRDAHELVLPLETSAP